MQLSPHTNYVLDVSMVESGIPGLRTLEIHQTFPQAQHPRAQRILQLTLKPSEFNQLGQFIITNKE